jgi:hypothetical protein
MLLSPLALLLGRGRASGASQTRSTYRLDLGVLYGLLSFSAAGTLTEEIDRAAGRYRVTVSGQGLGITHTNAYEGIIRGGRFLPVESRGSHVVRGRENTTLIRYDHDRSVIEFHAVSYTLLLGRRRQVDDVLRLAPGQQVDDSASTSLNFEAGKLEPDADGYYRTLVVRRARAETEGPDDVSPSGYRAELVPLRFRVAPDPSSGRFVGSLDLTSLSSWARSGQPGRISFDPERRLESVQSPLILGSTVTIRIDRGA